MRHISIVVPVYYNAMNLPDTIPQLLDLGQSLKEYALELVFVDDGSGDRSLDILLDFQTRFPGVIKVVKLTRNFGSMAAIQAGLLHVTGDCIGMISADLQDPPELFRDMISWWEKGSKAIFAVRQGRQDPFWQKLASGAYYALVRKFAIPDYPDGGFDYFLVDRQVILEVNRIHEKNTNLMTLIYWLGYKPIILPYIRQARVHGKSRWTFAKKIKLFIDTFVAFSFFPIRMLSVLGILVALTSFSYGAFILVYWMLFGISVQGWVPIMLSITFASGTQMVMLGVLGEYVWRILDEIRKRPLYVIDEVYDLNTPAVGEK